MGTEARCIVCHVLTPMPDCYFRNPDTGRLGEDAYCIDCYERLSALAQWQGPEADHICETLERDMLPRGHNAKR
jgi:hypothetical protein